MTRVSVFSSPLLLGFDDLERLLERAVKTSGEGYPPYNIERLTASENTLETIRITIAVAGFLREDLEVTIENNQLNIRGRTREDQPRDYLHRGIAGRQFHKAFVLADGMDVMSAHLANGLLAINLQRPEPTSTIRNVEIEE
jgi:HSP20 family molecular chaperone IbpA